MSIQNWSNFNKISMYYTLMKMNCICKVNNDINIFEFNVNCIMGGSYVKPQLLSSQAWPSSSLL